MHMIFEKEITQNLDKSSDLEWLETNGLGGWASSAPLFVSSRIMAIIVSGDTYNGIQKNNLLVNILSMPYFSNFNNLYNIFNRI